VLNSSHPCSHPAVLIGSYPGPRKHLSLFQRNSSRNSRSITRKMLRKPLLSIWVKFIRWSTKFAQSTSSRCVVTFMLLLSLTSPSFPCTKMCTLRNSRQLILRSKTLTMVSKSLLRPPVVSMNLRSVLRRRMLPLK